MSKIGAKAAQLRALRERRVAEAQKPALRRKVAKPVSDGPYEPSPSDVAAALADDGLIRRAVKAYLKHREKSRRAMLRRSQGQTTQ